MPHCTCTYSKYWYIRLNRCSAEASLGVQLHWYLAHQAPPPAGETYNYLAPFPCNMDNKQFEKRDGFVMYGEDMSHLLATVIPIHSVAEALRLW